LSGKENPVATDETPKTVTIEDEVSGTGVWDRARLARAKVELEEIDKRLRDADVAANPPPAPDFNQMSDAELRNLCIEGDRAKRAQREAEQRAALEAQAQNRRGY
jgi:hypothetical protein